MEFQKEMYPNKIEISPMNYHSCSYASMNLYRQAYLIAIGKIVILTFEIMMTFNYNFK